ncbi:MAG: PKD domain-containing protein, partial [Candidatus Zixiibacteriota bacterium]
PLPVNFTGSSGLAVDTWTWDFGDGDSAFVQSPSHTYNSPGMFNISLQVDAGGDIRRIEKPGYIVALADSLISFDTAALKGASVEVAIYARNTVPMRTFKIPVLFDGTLDLSYDSFSTAGCRTDYFENQSYLHYDVANNKVTIKLESSSTGTSPDLAPGTGPILKLYFTIPYSAADSQTATITVSGYDTRLPEFAGYNLVYEPLTASGTVSVCPQRGDMDGLPGITVADITYFVAYLFQMGPPPQSDAVADVDCSGGVNIADLTYLVEYLFQFGPPPCGC